MVVLTGLCSVSAAYADISAESKTRAAQAFDAGVQHFKNAEFVEAAKAFLLADELLPSSTSLSNALAAARKANDDLLLVRSAQRGIARAAADPELGTSSRQALVDAERRLARLELRCEPEPCILRVDGQTMSPGQTHLIPGTHGLSAEGNGGQATERITVQPGVFYRVVLYPGPTSDTSKKALISSDGAAVAPLASDKPVVEHGSKPATREPPKDGNGNADPPRPEATGKPLAPWMFWTGVGVTTVLAGVTTWSGVDALSAKSDLPRQPTRAQNNVVEDKIDRTNIFLGVTLLAGAATAASGLFFVEWGSPEEAKAVSVLPTGNGVTAFGTF